MEVSRVFIGNLPAGCSIRDVEKFFKGYGKIRSVVLKSTKYGFVDFYKHEDASKAVIELDGQKLNGNRIPVEHGKGVKKAKSGEQARWTTKYGTMARTDYRMLVENLSSSITWQDLKDIMRKHGQVTYAQAHKEKKREGVVEFSCEEDLNRAHQRMNGQTINGRIIQCTKLFEPRPRSRSWSRCEVTERSRSEARSISPEKSAMKELSGENKSEKHEKEREQD